MPDDADFLPSVSDEALLDGLNPPQRAAVLYRGQALLIVAGAGSGKTRVLTHRIASLLHSRDAWPSQILAITFTNKAATNMRERVAELLGGHAKGMWISTFHSACVRILRREAEHFGFSSSFTIYDSADARALIKRLVKNHEADRYNLTPAGVHSRISALKNELSDADSYARQAQLDNPAEQLLAEIFRDYQNELRRANAFDFDDLIAQTVYLFRAFPDVANAYRRRFRHILVDEYQDTNHAQYALIYELTRPVTGQQSAEEYVVDGMLIQDAREAATLPASSLTVVGDSDQSIYAFRGADIRNITEFERDFPGAEVITLEQNYRSTQTILSAANAVIGNNFDRKDKKLWTDIGDGDLITGFTGYSQHDEAQFLADEIEALTSRGVPFNQIAVFYRTNSQSRAIEEIFIRSGIAYRIMGGTRFYERAEIKDALAYLTVVANPADELALRRIINKPKRSIGDVTVEGISNFAETAGITFREALARSDELGISAKARTEIAKLNEVLTRASDIMLPASGEVPPASAVAEGLTVLLDDSGYRPSLQASGNPQDDARLENLDEFIAVAREFGQAHPDGTVLDFLTEVALVSDSDDLGAHSGSVSLMTLHTAKGLEFDAVFLTGIEEELLPHRISTDEPGGLAEERRLFYVGVTRARKRLFLSLAMTRAQFGQIAPAAPSRFLQEIPGELINWRQSPGHFVATRSLDRASSTSRDSLRESGFSGSRRVEASRKKASATEFPNRISTKMRQNTDLVLEAKDRIRHDDFGEGTVDAITGEGAKRVAHVSFDSGAAKKLLIAIAPIEKL